MSQLHGRRLRRTTIGSSSAVLALVLAVMLGGCATASPAGARNASAHGALESPSAGGVAELSAGVGAVHSDEPPADPRAGSDVSLGGLLVYADQHSPVLAVARSTRSRAQAAHAAASLRIASNPELAVAVGPRFGNAGTDLNLEVTLMQEFQVAGEREQRLQVAERLRELTDAEIEQLRWAVHCDIHAAFHRSLVDLQRAQLAGRVVAFQRHVLDVVERQISAGETAPLALRLAQAEVAEASQVSVAAEQSWLVSRLRLAQLSGWPAATPPRPGGAVDAPRDPPPLEHLNSVARQRLPSLRAQHARVREAAARAELAERESAPRPSVGVQYRREGGAAVDDSYDSLLGVVSVPIPVFQRNQADRARARAELTVTRAGVDAAERLLDVQIAEARSEVVAAAARTRAYGSEILPRFEENLTLLRRSFELGEIDILALSTGRERFLRIQSDALAAYQDYFVALSGLERVVGVDLWHDEHPKETTP